MKAFWMAIAVAHLVAAAALFGSGSSTPPLLIATIGVWRGFEISRRPETITAGRRRNPRRGHGE
jgi:hypothetical protein